MEILIDTREQPTPRARKRYETFGVPYRRVTLSYGDYSYNATLPGGERLYEGDGGITPSFSIERKMDLDELASCFTRGRDRFRREFERARDNNARIFLIVENATWENLLAGKYRSRVHPSAFLASITAWTIRYNMNLIFCKEETTGKLIKELCYRDLKERLERGVYDNRRDKTAV